MAALREPERGGATLYALQVQRDGNFMTVGTPQVMTRERATEMFRDFNDPDLGGGWQHTRLLRDGQVVDTFTPQPGA